MILPMKKSNHYVIFIPGFKGSVLHNQHEQLIWPNILRAQISHAALNYHLPELDLPNRYRYHSTAMIKSVSVIPRMLEYDFYGNFINQFTKQFSNKIQLITFHYDWRDHLHVAISRLNELIKKLTAQEGTTIDIICHSMGGL